MNNKRERLKQIIKEEDSKVRANIKGNSPSKQDLQNAEIKGCGYERKRKVSL